MSPETREKFKDTLNQRCVSLKEKLTPKGCKVIITDIQHVFDDYELLRAHAHTVMGGKALYECDPLMDQHKIAACFLASIIVNKPLKITSSASKIPFMVRSANVQLGIVFGFYILDIFRKSTYKLNPGTDNANHFVSKQDLKLPVSHDGKYMSHLIRLIYNEVANCAENAVTDDRFGVAKRALFFLSHIFFLLDEYSTKYWHLEFAMNHQPKG